MIFWLVVSDIFMFHNIYGMSSFPLTFTPSFFKMVIAPPTSNGIVNHGLVMNEILVVYEWDIKGI